MSNSIFTMFNKYFPLWIKWIFSKVYFDFKHPNKHLAIGYMARFSNCIFGHYNTLYEGAQLTNVSIGNFSYVSSNTKITNTEIGKFSCIGPEVLAGLGRHPSRDFVSSHPIFYSPLGQAQITFASKPFYEEFEKIKIGNDVWIGARAIICDGVTIGDGVIVGAGALVTKDIPAYAVVGGVPAKVLRYRFEPKEIEFLQEFKWWDKNVDWLRENYEQFHNIEKLMQLKKSKN